MIVLKIRAVPQPWRDTIWRALIDELPRFSLTMNNAVCIDDAAKLCGNDIEIEISEPPRRGA